MGTRYYACVDSDDEYAAIRTRLRGLPLTRARQVLNTAFIKTIDDWSGRTRLVAVDVPICLGDVERHLASKGLRSGTAADLGLIAWNKGRTSAGLPILQDTDFKHLMLT